MNKTKYWIGRGVKNAILILFSLFCVFPLIWVVIAATNSSVDIVSGVLTPGSHLLENWKTLTENSGGNTRYDISCIFDKICRNRH